MNPYQATEKPLENSSPPEGTASKARHWSLRIKDWMVIVFLFTAMVIIGLLAMLVLPIML